MFGIPTWVIILFFALVYIGIKRCFTRVTPLKKIAMLPLIILLLGLKSVNSTFGFSMQASLFLAAGAMLGIYLGYLQVKNKNILADKEKNLIQIPGDISLFVSLMLVFFIEFFIHYAIDAHWSMAEFSIFKFAAIFLSGAVIGLTSGRSLAYFYKYISSGHTRLSLQAN